MTSQSTVAALALAFLPFSTPALAEIDRGRTYQEQSLMPLLGQVMELRAFLNECPNAIGELIREQMLDHLLSAQNRIEDALALRAAQLPRNAAEKDIKEKVGRWVSDQFDRTSQRVAQFSPGNCRSLGPLDILRQVDQIRSDETRSALEQYSASLPAYSERRRLHSFPGVLTFAAPSTEARLLSHVVRAMEQSDCNAVEVTSVELLSRSPTEHSNLPPFISKPTRYEERWRVACGSVEAEFDMSFPRDSDGPNGVMSIKRVSP